MSGGVSSWVHQIINGFPELTFAICFLGSRKQDYGAKKFKLPANVVHLEEHYLNDASGAPPIVPQRGNLDMFDLNAELHDYFRAPAALAQRGAAVLEQMTSELEGRMDRSQLLYTEPSWTPRPTHKGKCLPAAVRHPRRCPLGSCRCLPQC